MVPSLPRSRLFVVLLLPLLAILSGCAGGGTYSLNPGDIAERYLPTTRSVDHHPDSLRSFSITENENTLQANVESSYEALHRKWSCTFQSLDTRASRRTYSYATLRSKEIALASLEAEIGFSSLTKERARQLLKERTKEYQNAIQIDLYWFQSDGSTLVAGPGSRVELVIDGEPYRPVEESNGPLREAFLLQGDGRSLYRRNIFYFARTVDGTDILEDATRVVLTINRTGRRVRFSWTWEAEGESEARLGGERRPGRSVAARREDAFHTSPYSLFFPSTEPIRLIHDR